MNDPEIGAADRTGYPRDVSEDSLKGKRVVVDDQLGVELAVWFGWREPAEVSSKRRRTAVGEQPRS